MKKEYKTPEAEVMVFDYEENVVASRVVKLGNNDPDCYIYNDKTQASECPDIKSYL